MTRNQTYISPETILITLMGIHGVMDGDEPIGPGLATSPSKAEAGTLPGAPARKLYL